eukprot:s1291_g10.t1
MAKNTLLAEHHRDSCAKSEGAGNAGSVAILWQPIDAPIQAQTTIQERNLSKAKAFETESFDHRPWTMSPSICCS